MSTKKFSLPKTISISGIDYEIEVGPTELPPMTIQAVDANGRICTETKLPDNPLNEYEIQGLCRFGDGKIVISDRLENKDIVLSVLCHEITHAILHSIGFELEEAEVQALSQGIFRLFKDNKWVWY